MEQQQTNNLTEPNAPANPLRAGVQDMLDLAQNTHEYERTASKCMVTARFVWGMFLQHNAEVQARSQQSTTS